MVFRTAKNLSDAEKEIYLAVQHYKKAVESLEIAGNFLAIEQFLELLAIRNEVDAVWKDLPKNRQKRWLKIVNQLDAQLSSKKEYINRTINPEAWQFPLPLIERERLGWFQKLPKPKVEWNQRLDWLWRFLSIVCLGFSFYLLADIVKRSISSGFHPEQILTIAGSIFLSLLPSGTLFTKAGQEKAEAIFARLTIPNRWWNEVRLGISAGVLIILFSVWHFLPLLSNYYVDAANRATVSAQKEEYLNQALGLNSRAPEVYISLGKHYEEQQDPDKAIISFKAAYRNSSRKDVACQAAASITQVFLDKKDYDRADDWLIQATETEKLGKEASQTCKSQNFDLVMRLGRIYLTQNSVRALFWYRKGLFAVDNIRKSPLETSERAYKLLVYMGWSQLNMGVLADAEATLMSAILLEETEILPRKSKTSSQPTERQASAHCLLAQVLEKSAGNRAKDTKVITKEWMTCTSLTKYDSEDELRWSVMATKYFSKLETKE